MNLPFCRKVAARIRTTSLYSFVHTLCVSSLQYRYLLWFAPGAMLVLVGLGLFLEPSWVYPLLALFVCVLGLWMVAVIAFARRILQMVNRIGSSVVAQVRIAGVAPTGPFEQTPEGEIKKVVLH